MKVQGPSGTQKTSDTKKSSKSKGASGGNFGSLLGASETSGTQGSAASASINSIDALLAVQASENPTEKAAKSRMKQRAHDLLDKLENLKMKVLTGGVTVGELLSVADVVASHREKISDPHLTSILDEIDLRAQIEIAKLTVAMQKKA